MKIAKWTAVFLAAFLLWAAVAVVLAFYGWWMTPVVAAADSDGFQQWAVNELNEKNKGSSALVLIEGGDLRFDAYQPQAKTNGDTLFPTASFSKFITGLSVLRLAESNRVDLDAPVSRYLTRWQLPDSPFNNDAVTVRQLLSHTAGLTDQLGFGDYAANEDLPSTVESLKAPRSSRDDVQIRVGAEPGSEFLYSGGGYLILQLLVEELTGESFASFAETEILRPLGMRRSTYAYLGGLSNATPSFDSDGAVSPSFQYAAAAATGLNSTANDLVRLVAGIRSADNGVLSRRLVDSLRQPHGYMMGAGIWGLGSILYAPTPNGDVVFGHDGANEPAINVALRINPDNWDAIVLLVSGHPSLASDIGAEWVLWQTGYPDVLSTDRVLSSAVGPIGIGGAVLLLLVIAMARRGRESAQ